MQTSAIEDILEGYARIGGAAEIDRLRTALRQAYAAMTEAQRISFLSSPTTIDTYESALCEEGIPAPEGVERLVDAALRHGEDSDPDMEPGDLQVFLREAYAHLDAAQRADFEANAPAEGSRPTL